MENNSLAYELLQELKRSSKRWFIISIIELTIIVSMIIGFFIYESQYSYETTEDIYQYTDKTEYSTIDQSIGE